MNVALLAPAIVGGAVGLVGLAVLFWMNRTQPVLQRPVTETASDEEQSSLPFDERDRDPEPEVRPQFRKQFEKHDWER